ncbi:retrovirus-related pol polyprotein from transposon TNT 1-94 [Tanacetum coccineum]
MGLWYLKDSCIALTAFADVDHTSFQDTRRSTFGSMQLLGDRLVIWSSKKQKSTAISSTEAEYIALSGCSEMLVNDCDWILNFERMSRSKLADVDYGVALRRYKEQQLQHVDDRVLLEGQWLKLFKKEETFQVIIDVIKNSTCYKAFTISAEVPEIFMHQFWYTIKKILDICPSVQGLDFAKVLDDETTLTFLFDLGYKGPLHKHPSMYVDHMHQPWRTLAAIINKCLSGKAASNDRLRESKIDTIWGMFYMENVDYLELIWEDFAFQIDYRQLKKGISKNIPYPRFTKIIINHFLSKHQSISKLQYLHIHIIKDDGVIKQSESYQMFIKNCIGQIPPKKSRGKGSQGKKTIDTSEADVEVSEEFDSEPTRNQTSSRRVIKKKVIISVDDNIIPEPDIALELGKSISLTEAIKEEAARQVHATHARIMTKSVPEPVGRRPSGIVFRDTSSVSKKKSHDLSQNLKGVQTLTPEEQLVADTMKALKESKKTNRRQSGTGGSSEELVLHQEFLMSPQSSLLSQVKELSEYSEEDDDDDDDDDDDNDDDDKSINLEKTDDEETDDEFVHSEENVQDDDEDTDDEETDDELVHANEQVNDDEDEEMTNAEEADTGNGDEENIVAAKADVEKTKVVKDEIKKAKLPPKISSLFVSPGFDPLHVVIQRVYVLKKDVQELKEADNTITLRALLISEIPSAINAYLGSSLGDALQKVLQKYMEKLIQKYPQQVDYKEMIEESVQANIINEVKNQLPKFLPKAVFDFTNPVIQSMVKNALEKTPLPVA